MTRGFYIAVAVGGMALVLLAGLAAVVSAAPPGWESAGAVAEVAAGLVGAGLAYGGLTAGRTAGTYDVRMSARDRRRDAAAPPAAELAFDCPVCGRTYRASEQMAGRPFACRACDTRFTIPR